MVSEILEAGFAPVSRGKSSPSPMTFKSPEGRPPSEAAKVAYVPAICDPKKDS